jgi:DNA end-binding protein Ku
VIGATGAILARRRQRALDLARAQGARVRGVSEAGRKRVARLKREPDLEELTKEELYHRAQAADIPGRSEMSKDELIAALRTSTG